MRRTFIVFSLIGSLFIITLLLLGQHAMAAPVAQATATPTFRPTRTPIPTTPTATPSDAIPLTTTEETDVTLAPAAPAAITETTPPSNTTVITASERLTPATAFTLSPVIPLTETVETATERTLTVQGMGEVQASPDLATITLGVVTLNTSAADAVDENNAVMTNVLEALLDAGIAEEDIRTVEFGIYPEEQPVEGAALDRESEAPTPQIRYRVVNRVAVVVREIERVGEVLDAALDAGANTVGGISFGVSNAKALERQARAAAMQDAYQRASDLATLANVELVGVLTIREQSAGRPILVEQAAFAETRRVPIQSGQLSFTYGVEVIFLIR
nr:SIMPL domain-containing protein [Ardenticatena sp.]